MFAMFMPLNKLRNMFGNDRFCLWHFCFAFSKSFIAHFRKFVYINDFNMWKVLHCWFNIVGDRKIKYQLSGLLLYVRQQNGGFSGIGSDQDYIRCRNVFLQFTYWRMV